MSENIGLTSCLYCSERACQVAYDAIEEITRLRAERAALQSQVNAFYLGTSESRLLAMTKECDALRAALQGIVEFVDAPVEGKRPDVFALRINKARAALKETTNG